MTVNEGQETVVCKHLKRCLLTNNSTVEDTTAHNHHYLIALLLEGYRKKMAHICPISLTSSISGSITNINNKTFGVEIRAG